MRETVHGMHFRAEIMLDRAARHLAQQYEPTAELWIVKANVEARIHLNELANAIEREYRKALEKAPAQQVSG